MLPATIAFALALIIGTFVEYWGHRLMHAGRVLRKRHAGHHQRGTGKGVFGEFLDYSLPTLLIAWIGFLHSPEAGVGFLLGDLFYATVAAYAHQLQHEHPEMVFWLRRPVHSLHHYHSEWHHNFGILVDFWDRVFGTYRAHEAPPEWADAPFETHKLWRIRWVGHSPPLPKRPRRTRSSGPG